jgi:hypothetical protein
MARKVSGGLAGGPNVGAINIDSSAVVTAVANQNITLSPLGTASVVLAGNTFLTAQNDLRFGDNDSSNWVAFQAPATVATNITWTLPATDGTNLQVLSTNGSGTLSWQTTTLSLEDNTTDSTTHFVTLTTATTNTTITSVRRSSTKLSFQPSTGTLSATAFSGSTLAMSGTSTFTGAIVANGGTSGIIGYAVQTGGALLGDADRRFIVANGGAITLTLPATSTNGRTIVLADGNNFSSFNVTVARNGKTIGGLAEDLILNVRGSKVELVHYNNDWKVFAI